MEGEEAAAEAPSGGGGLSDAGISGLKALIDEHLRKSNVYAEIQGFVSEFGKAHGTEVLDTVKERQLIGDVIRSLQVQRPLAAGRPLTQEGTATKAGEQYLLVKILGGRDFEAGPEGERLVLSVHYGDQRFQAVPVQSTKEPRFDAAFLVRLSRNFAIDSAGKMSREHQLAGLRRLLVQGHDDEERDEKRSKHHNAIHFVLVRQKASDSANAKELVASHLLEWRHILVNSGGASVVVELSGLGPAAKVRMPVGTLDIRLDLVPGPLTPPKHSPNAAEPGSNTSDENVDPSNAKAVSRLLSQGEVSSALKAETTFFSDLHRQFCQYARVWWQEYVEANPSFRNRLVKIFAENEFGEHVPSCSFVQPMQADRLLDSPRHAARFVSLIPYAREEVAGGGRTEIWHSFHSFFSKGHGDCEDHAVLLCSLLLGFGLHAFVCVGTVKDSNDEAERDHVWVVTLSGKRNRTCVFWESLTGQRLDLALLESSKQAQEQLATYRRVGCLFNHTSFFANKQVDDRVTRCSFDVADDSKWKAMDERLFTSLKRSDPFPLRRPTMIPSDQAQALEAMLRKEVSKLRRETHDLSTQWDNDLSYFLSQALAAYETERCTGVLPGNADFQQVVKRHIPNGHSFKGYPTTFNHCNSSWIMQALKQSPVAMDIMETRADHTYFALRVRVEAHPENMCSVWVMVAVRARYS